MDFDQGGGFVAKTGPQYLAATIASIGAFGLGTAMGWTSPALPSIVKQGDFDGLQSESETASWIGAIATLGCAVAGTVAGLLIQKLGRKMTILLLVPPFVAGWLLVAFASNITMLLVGRFMTGFCGGAFTLIVPVYASEIGQDHLRGVLCNIMGIILVAGICFVYLLGKLLEWKWISIVCAFIPAILGVGMLFMPESPRYLFSKGKTQEGRNALKWLRGASYDGQIDAEVKVTEKSIESDNAQSVSLKDLLAGPVLKPTVICLTIMFLQQFSGINAVIFYSTAIFQAAGTKDLSDLDSAIIISCVQVALVVVSTVLVDRLGRKILLVVSGFGMGVSLAALGAFFYLQAEGKDDGLGWLPLASLILYTIFYNLGMGPLPWTIMGELLPQHVKGVTSSIATAFCWGLAFIITKFFTNMLDALEPYGCYWLFGGVCIGGAIFSLLIVPETKGKSFEQIRALFS